MAFTLTRLFSASNSFKSRTLLTSYINHNSIGCSAGKKTVAEELGFPNPPKRPVTPAFRYVLQESKNYSHLPRTEIISKLSHDWGQLEEDVKKTYTEEYKKDYELYIKRKEDYFDLLTPEQIDQMKDLEIKRRHEKKVKELRRAYQKEIVAFERPMNPGNGVSVFNRAVKGKVQGSADIPYVSKVAKLWKELPESERVMYKEISRKKNEAYLKEMDLWEDKMIALGREDLIRRTSLRRRNSKTSKNKLQSLLQNKDKSS